MAQVAMASGFKSIRRFNDVFRESYGRSPSGLRRRGMRGLAQDEYVFDLAYRPPYDWGALLRFLGARLVPGMESIQDDRYRRVVTVHGHHGLLEVRQLPAAHALRAHIQFSKAEYLLQIITSVRHLFDLAADPDVIGRVLGADSRLAPLLGPRFGVRIPGAWNPLEPIVHAVLRQAFSLAETRCLQGLLVQDCGAPVAFRGADELCRAFPTASVLAKGHLTFLPEATARIIRSAAEAVAGGQPAAPPEDLLIKLRKITGVIDSTLEYVAMRALNDSDAFPAGEEDLRRAMGTNVSASKLRQHALVWKPWRGYAAMLLM